MKQRWINTISILLGMFALNAAPAEAASGPGPYYAIPSWDQKIDPASDRFIVLTDWNNQAVLDLETGLVWERTPSALTDTWGDIHTHCLRSTVGGRMGWRLPKVEELASLLDPSQSSPALPVKNPFLPGLRGGWSGDIFWTGTTIGVSSKKAYTVDFRQSGAIGGSDKNYDKLRSWCVRGGAGYNGQYW